MVIPDRRETIERLHNLFQSVNLCCLPHPGPQIPKSHWRGNVGDISTDFLYLLTHFFLNLTHGDHPLKVAAPLGQELTVGSFCRVVEELVDAFRGARPDAVSLRTAFVNCEVGAGGAAGGRRLAPAPARLLLSSGSFCRVAPSVEWRPSGGSCSER